MRNQPDFNPDQYAEWPQDGRSHIRAQLLWDFYSLLNHDIAGYDKTRWPDDDSTNDERNAYAFVKETKYDDVPLAQIAALDALAELLADDPPVERLVDFYRSNDLLWLSSAEQDPACFVFQDDRQPS